MRHKWSQTKAAVLLTLVARALTATGSDAAPAGSLASIITEGVWGQCTALQTARQDFRALTLQAGPLQGQILAMGGCCDGSGSLAGTEIFNPSTGNWQPTGDLQMPRWLFEAVPLANGSALAVGGFGVASGGVLNSMEIFEPAKGGRQPYGSWRQAADMHTARQEFQLVTLDSGRILAVGGYMALAEIYDPGQDAWTKTAPMAEARSNFQAVKLSSGRVLAIGGRGRDAGALASSELYDPAAQAWEQQGGMTYPRASFAAVELDDGRVLVAGGNNGFGSSLNSSEVYDPETGNWTETASMAYQRSDLQAIKLPSGDVLVVGGLGGKDDLDTCILDSVEVFDPATEKWSLMSPMMDGRYVFQMVMLSNGTCMAIGGTSTSGFTATTEVFTMQL